MTEDCLYVFFSKEGETSWIWRWCIDYGKKVIRNLFFCTTWNDRWRQLSLSLQILVYNKHPTKIFLSKRIPNTTPSGITRVFRPATKRISVEILRAGINQIATLCYHQYKLNGANLKDGAMNIIPLNIWKTKLTAT